jgi:hypothetical protein
MSRSRTFRTVLLSAVAGAALGAVLSADVVVLKDGRRIDGQVLSESGGKVTVRTGLGDLEFPSASVVEIVRSKTARQEFAEREAAAKTAGEFFALGEWARDKKLESLAKKAWKRAVELDGDHAGAREALGFVRYQDRWLTPQERDLRVLADEDAAMAERGLVRHGERWVTPADKARLDAGLVEHEGRWVTPDEQRRLEGFEFFGGEWIPRAQALARSHAADVARLTELRLEPVLTEQVLIAGPFERPWLVEVAAALDVGRNWFDGAFGVEPGLGLYGGSMVEMYVWGRDERPYVQTVQHFAALTPVATPEWAAAATRAFGLYWFDPYPLSSARAAHRNEADLAGHCAHHLGHLMLGRLGYDGRLIAPWYDESLAGLVEFRVFARNAVFCQTRGKPAEPGPGSTARDPGTRYDYDTAQVRDGRWRETLKAALEAQAVAPFDRLAQKDFSDLDLLDVAAGMGILSWLESRTSPAGGPALGAWHSALRASAPPVPLRMIADAQKRGAAYDAAFRAAVGMDRRTADKEWRTWLLSQ